VGIVYGPSITNVTYSTTPEATAVHGTIEYAIYAVLGRASFVSIVFNYVFDKLETDDYDGTYTKSYYVREFYAEGAGSMNYYQYAWKTLVYSSSVMSDYYLDTVNTQYDESIRLANE